MRIVDLKCAVIGTLNGSPIVPPGVPFMILAIRRATSLPTGIHDGFGSPCPCLLEYQRRPSFPRLVNVVIELSRF